MISGSAADWAILAIQAMQTVVLVCLATALIFSLNLMRKEFRGAAKTLKKVVDAELDIRAGIERCWKRIDELEMRQGVRSDGEELGELRRFLDALRAIRVPETVPPAAKPPGSNLEAD